MPVPTSVYQALTSKRNEVSGWLSRLMGTPGLFAVQLRRDTDFQRVMLVCEFARFQGLPARCQVLGGRR